MGHLGFVCLLRLDIDIEVLAASRLIPRSPALVGAGLVFPNLDLLLHQRQRPLLYVLSDVPGLQRPGRYKIDNATGLDAPGCGG